MSKYKLIINLKNYKESFGSKAIYIAKICKDLAIEARKKNVDIILCPQTLDLRDVSSQRVKIYAQHIDPIDYGKYTGFIVPKAVKKIGAIGTLINHSEHRLDFTETKKRVDIAKSITLQTCICAQDENEAKEFSKLKPDFIAFEPPDLIGGDISVSTAEPEIIARCKKAVGKIPLLVGAGVKNKQDVKKSIELGAIGILVASGVVKAKDVKKEILELIQGF